MAKVYDSVLELVGTTPLLRLHHMEQAAGAKAKVLAKLELFNPSRSVKDRIAKAMLEEAEESGKLKPGATIIEPTSGNTGIGLALAAAAKGYSLILVMPSSMSVERRKLMGGYGAKLVLTSGKEGMKGAIAKAQELAEEIPDSFIPGQFVNPENPAIHRRTTGPEIWEDTDGNIDILVAGVGTGGTLTGGGGYLKEKNPGLRVIAVEPESSPVLSGGNAGSHKIQGIGSGFVPEVLDVKLIDEVLTISDKEAYQTAAGIAGEEGILVGISSGAAAAAALRVASREENAGKNIVVILPDTGERYLSTEVFGAVLAPPDPF